MNPSARTSSLLHNALKSLSKFIPVPHARRTLVSLIAVGFALPVFAVNVPAAQADTFVAPWVQTCGEHFCDQSGKQVTLRGYNVPLLGGTKKFVTYSSAALNMNGNFMRLRIPWDMIEPNAPVGDVHS